jgi:hypothetical protein
MIMMHVVRTVFCQTGVAALCCDYLLRSNYCASAQLALPARIHVCTVEARQHRVMGIIHGLVSPSCKQSNRCPPGLAKPPHHPSPTPLNAANDLACHTQVVSDNSSQDDSCDEDASNARLEHMAVHS